MENRVRTLVAHPWMGRGGSEATAMWVLQALQDSHEITFVTASDLDWKSLNTAYGTLVDSEKISVRRASRLPTVKSGTRLVNMQIAWFERFCQKISADFDVCISSYNPIDFGKPGIQLIGDFSFSEEMRRRLYIHGDVSPQHRDSLVRNLYLGAAKLLGVRTRPLSERNDLVLANSDWAAGQLEKYFHLSNAPVIYPPVILPRPSGDCERNPLGFVCLGRISPEKEIERIISILKTVRQQGYLAHLTLIGHLGDSVYERKVASLVEQNREWITPAGFLDVEEKQELLSQNSFALHACRIEAFGIAVAEMASMGCIPFVPTSGGAGEIVADPELQFSTEDEAVKKIVALLDHPEEVEELRFHLSQEVAKFGPSVFMNELREHAGKFLDKA